jgi:serine protease Do
MSSRSWILVAVLFLATSVFAQDPGWIGASVADQQDRGVLVIDVQADGPAARAGLKANDVILEFNREEVVGVLQLTRLVRETPVGRVVDIKYQRNNATETAKLTVGRVIPATPPFRSEIPDIPGTRPPNIASFRDTLTLDFPDTQINMSASQFGLRVDSLTPQLRDYFGVRSNEGALVSSVDARSAAGQAGLKAGDVIVSVNDRRIASPQEVFRELSSSDMVTLRVVRDKREQDIRFETPNRSRPGPALNRIPGGPAL